ncbi:MAG: TraB family protein, partial [Gammaproteobacteria bacterium]|nr:TraB family protein [Gammaproteobacteria bacterium]
IEMYLLGKKPDQAQILELESVTEQIGMLEQLNGETFLAYTLAEFEEGKEQIQQMIDAWRCADLKQLQNILFSELATEAETNPELQKLMEMLFFDRNKKMSAGIREYLEHGQDDYFVVVGAGHLIGDRSIIDILDDKYQVTAVRLQ